MRAGVVVLHCMNALRSVNDARGSIRGILVEHRLCVRLSILDKRVELRQSASSTHVVVTTADGQPEGGVACGSVGHHAGPVTCAPHCQMPAALHRQAYYRGKQR